ncbi:MAG: hypothetical protein ACI9UV_001259 [Algoriphagus sp.]|jgi:hypothetical protein
MKLFLKIGSLIGLLLTMTPPILIFLGKIDLDTTKLLMTIGMVAWFSTAPFWINKKVDVD